MKFYMIFDKREDRYVLTHRPRWYSQPRKRLYYRIYGSAAHAASAAAGMIGKSSLPKDERDRLRKEAFEIHEYESNSYNVVG